jgi:hypothetical protein
MIVTEAGEQSPRRNGLHLVTTLMTSIVSGQYQINQERGFRYKVNAGFVKKKNLFQTIKSNSFV